MSLNVNSEKLSSLQKDIDNIEKNTSETYGEMEDLSSSISGNWSSDGADAFLDKFNKFTSKFENYSSTLKGINNYLIKTEEEYNETTDAVKDTIED